MLRCRQWNGQRTYVSGKTKVNQALGPWGICADRRTIWGPYGPKAGKVGDGRRPWVLGLAKWALTFRGLVVGGDCNWGVDR
jgi:hypothetical protein